MTRYTRLGRVMGRFLGNGWASWTFGKDHGKQIELWDRARSMREGAELVIAEDPVPHEPVDLGLAANVDISTNRRFSRQTRS